MSTKGFYIYTADPQKPPCGFLLAWTGTDAAEFVNQIAQFNASNSPVWDSGSYDTSGPVPIIATLGGQFIRIWGMHPGDKSWAIMWTGKDYRLSQILVQDYNAADFKTYWTCFADGSAPPPPPPISITPPPPVTPPGGGGGGGGGDGGIDLEVADELTLILADLDALAIAFKTLTTTPAGKEPNYTVLLTNMGKALEAMLAALNLIGKELGGKVPENADPVTCAQLAVAVAALQGTILIGNQAIATAISNAPAEAPDPNVKRIADALNGFPPDGPDAQAKVAALAKLAVDKYGFPADLAQLIT